MEEIKKENENQVQIGSMDKLVEIYNQINTASDLVNMTAAMLTHDNAYTYALTLSNEINGRQGRNRYTSDRDTYKLMKYSLLTDVDEILDQRLTELLVDILNSYLSDKQELPSDDRSAAGMISRVKALMIMLISTNQYGLIPLLNIPNYMMKMVMNIFDDIRSLKEDVLDSWIKYLEQSGNKKMAEIVTSVGSEFWGSDGIKANVIYDRHFGKIRDEIINPIETYNAYLKFRAAYRKSTKNVIPSRIYEVFNITKDAYDRGKRNVYSEILDLFPEDSQVIKKLIFES